MLNSYYCIFISIILLCDCYTNSHGFVYNGTHKYPEKERIISHKKVRCFKEENSNILICSCENLKMDLYLLKTSLGSNADIIRSEYNRKTAFTGLKIIKCWSVKIYDNFLSWIEKPVHFFGISQVASFYVLGRGRALNFEYQRTIKVDISLSQIANPFFISQHNRFGGLINSLTFEDITLLEFNSNKLRGLNSKTDVIFRNCSFKTIDPGSESKRENIKSLLIENSDFEFAGHAVFNLSVSETVQFLQSNIKLVSAGAFSIINVKKIDFLDSTLELQGNSLEIKLSSDGNEDGRILFDQCTFNQPKSLCLRDVEGNGNSSIIFNNVVLIDPSRGTLVTGDGFASMEIQNMTISRCECNIIDYLIDDDDKGFILRMGLGNDFKDVLINNTLCYDKSSNSLISPMEICHRLNPIFTGESHLTDGFIIGFMICVASIIIIAILMLYYCQKKGRDKRMELIKSWTVAFPRPKSYRETTVKLDLDEQVQTLSTPADDTIYYIEPTEAVLKISKENASFDHRPDLVRGIEHDYENIKNNEEVEENRDKNRHPKYTLRKELSVIVEEEIEFCDVEPLNQRK